VVLSAAIRASLNFSSNAAPTRFSAIQFLSSCVLIPSARTLAEALELGQNVCDIAVERGLDGILVDCLALEGDLSNGARYELGKTIAEYCRSRSMSTRVAVIGKKPTITGFSARIAANRGAMIQTFSDRQAGLDWLNGFGSKATAT
jgi:hypothetical protein